MMSLSTQNLKALGLWIFFLVYCLTFSFLPNVGLRLTLEYLTIPLSSESPSSTLIHSLSNGSKRPHLYEAHLPEISIMKTFDARSNWAHSPGFSFLYIVQLSHSYPMWFLDYYENKEKNKDEQRTWESNVILRLLWK